MSTRGTISLKLDSGKYRTIYIHNCTPGITGALLKKCIDTKEKVKEILKLGSISAIFRKEEFEADEVLKYNFTVGPIYDTGLLFKRQEHAPDRSRVEDELNTVNGIYGVENHFVFETDGWHCYLSNTQYEGICKGPLRLIEVDF